MENKLFYKTEYYQKNLILIRNMLSENLKFRQKMFIPVKKLKGLVRKYMFIKIP